MIEYTDPALVTEVRVTDPPSHGGRHSTGYGPKIPTRYQVYLHKRWRRVYVMQYANSGSAYVIHQGKDVFLDSETEHRLEALT